MSAPTFLEMVQQEATLAANELLSHPEVRSVLIQIDWNLPSDTQLPFGFMHSRNSEGKMVHVGSDPVVLHACMGQVQKTLSYLVQLSAEQRRAFDGHAGQLAEMINVKRKELAQVEAALLASTRRAEAARGDDRPADPDGGTETPGAPGGS